jgi:vacuolar iron transporter family protein
MAPHADPPPSPPMRGSPGPSRNLALASLAYDNRDMALMIKAHDSAMGGQQEQHAHNIGEGLMTNSIKSLVFGGLDGIITTYAIICAAVGANFSHKTVIVMATANLIADAISMGVGDALSEKAEMDFVRREWDRESWEMDENPDGEVRERTNVVDAGSCALLLFHFTLPYIHVIYCR